MKRYEGSIEVGMVLTAPDNDGELGFRRVRVLAEHPDGGWIVDDLPSKMTKLRQSTYGPTVCPDINLRIVFQPE